MSRRLLMVLPPLLLGGCQLGTEEVGSRFIKSVPLWATEGGTVTVLPADDAALAGTSLSIPAGVLAADTTVTLEPAAYTLELAGDRTAGPAAAWGPAGLSFSRPVSLRLPFVLAEGQRASDLVVMVEEADGSRRLIPHDSLVVEEGAGVLRFEVPRLATVQPCTDDDQSSQPDAGTPGGSCSVDEDCSGGYKCEHGVCAPDDSGP